MALNRWTVLALLFTIHALMAMGPTSLPPLLGFIREDFQLDNAGLGLMSSAYYGGVVLTATFAGWAADAFGIRRMLVGGCMVSGIGLVLASMMPSYLPMVALLVVAGIGYSAITPATNKALMEWFHDRLRATAMGIKQTGINAGGFLAALLVPALALAFDWKYALAASGLLVAAAGLGVMVFYRKDAPVGGVADAGRLLAQLSLIVRSPTMIALGVENFFRVGVQYCLLTYLMLFLQYDLAMPLLAAASHLALAQAMGAVGRVGWGLLSDRLFGGHRKPVYILVSVFAAVAMLGLAQLEQGAPAFLVVLLVAMAGLAGAGFQGVGMSLVAEAAGRQSAGIASGFNNSLAFLGAVVLTPLCGAVIDASGSYIVGWYGLAAASLASAALVTLVVETPKVAAVPAQATGEIE